MLPFVLLVALPFLFACRVSAWGAAGHQIVATIAQIHLYPSAEQRVASILPSYAKGRLAQFAAWADGVRYQRPWSGSLHYVTPVNPHEHPPVECTLGHQWKLERNVFAAISNYSLRIANRVADDEADEDLRFLTHFIGDAHQPLHLVGRERGGNGDPVRWEGRRTSLHGLWDSALIARAIRDMRNYTRPLPSRQIEKNLKGSIYDSYIRWILWEGMRQWWRDDIARWLACPSTLPTHAWRAGDTSQIILPPKDLWSSQAEECPLQWAEPVHHLACEFVFPPGSDPWPEEPPDLTRTTYYQKIQEAKIIESLLAQAGLRLASALNLLLADPSELANSVHPADMSWANARFWRPWR